MSGWSADLLGGVNADIVAGEKSAEWYIAGSADIAAEKKSAKECVAEFADIQVAK